MTFSHLLLYHNFVIFIYSDSEKEGVHDLYLLLCRICFLSKEGKRGS